MKRGADYQPIVEEKGEGGVGAPELLLGRGEEIESYDKVFPCMIVAEGEIHLNCARGKRVGLAVHVYRGSTTGSRKKKKKRGSV